MARSIRPGDRPSQRQIGFTLIEMTIVIVLISVLALHLQPPLLHAMQARTHIADDLDAIRKLRTALDRIARELRQVEYDDDLGFLVSPTGSIIGNTSAGVCFSRLGTEDAQGSPIGSVVGFTHAAGAPGTVRYGSGGLGANGLPACNATGTDFVDEVLSLAFTYWGFSNTGAPLQLAPGAADLRARLRMVDVTLSVAAGGPGGPIQTTRVWLRNTREDPGT
jgi:prepilin-type N-terminal cleavage/methylation domain-containing protein